MAAAALAVEAGCGAASRAPAPRSACRTTIPNGSTPPGELRSANHHGNGRLWTQLPLRGEPLLSGVRFVPGDFTPSGVPGLHADGAATDKFYWWGARSAGPRLRVTGRRLDGPGRPLRAHIEVGTARSPHFWPSYLTFSTSGCWQVLAQAGRAKLAFRVLVSIPTGGISR